MNDSQFTSIDLWVIWRVIRLCVHEIIGIWPVLELDEQQQMTTAVCTASESELPNAIIQFYQERGLSILITYMGCFFAKTAVCTTNIITQPDYSCMAKGTNSAASCICSINNITGESLQGYH